MCTSLIKNVHNIEPSSSLSSLCRSCVIHRMGHHVLSIYRLAQWNKSSLAPSLHDVHKNCFIVLYIALWRSLSLVDAFVMRQKAFWPPPSSQALHIASIASCTRHYIKIMDVKSRRMFNVSPHRGDLFIFILQTGRALILRAYNHIILLYRMEYSSIIQLHCSLTHNVHPRLHVHSKSEFGLQCWEAFFFSYFVCRLEKTCICYLCIILRNKLQLRFFSHQISFTIFSLNRAREWTIVWMLRDIPRDPFGAVGRRGMEDGERKDLRLSRGGVHKSSMIFGFATQYQWNCRTCLNRRVGVKQSSLIRQAKSVHNFW